MNKILSVVIILLQLQVFANMSNPVQRGTIFSRPFVNQYVDVLHEDILIKIDSSFNTARFEITYYISASEDGVSIPFLFYASDLKGDFNITINGEPIKLLDIPEEYSNIDSTKFNDFSYLFNVDSVGINKQEKWLLFEDSSGGGFYLNLNDFLYFETDISKGKHKVKATYTADRWVNSGGWVNEYSFRYALSPAKYWKSFGTLNIKIDASGCDSILTTNLGEPILGDIYSIAEWEFDRLPLEILQIDYNPRISKTAQQLINIGPTKLAYITGFFLFVFHLLIVIWYRRKNLKRRFSLVVIIGSIIIPLAFVISWMDYYDVVDSYIGEHAGGSHGYIFFVVGLYPLIVPVYWVIFWLIDRWIKRRYTRSTNPQV